MASLAFVSRPSAALEAAAPIAGEPSPIVARAAEQFGIFVGRLRAYGLSVSDVPVSAAPQGACIGDIALLLPQGAILMRPSDAGRRPEVAAVEDALKRAGFAILGRIDPPGLLDGGDVLVAGATVYIGVPEHRRQLVGIPARGPRGNEHGRRQLSVLAGSLGYKAVNVSFSADVERLRSVCSAVDDETVISSAQLVDTPAFAGMKLVSIDPGDDYGAGVLRVAPRRVIVNVRFRSVVQALRRVKVAADSIDLWEFGKAGITPSLLALLPAGT